VTASFSTSASILALRFEERPVPAVVAEGRPLRVAVAVAPAVGATAAVNTLLPLLTELKPRCIAMCGVCAGRRGKVQLGDVVAADRLRQSRLSPIAVVCNDVQGRLCWPH
jgi:nucleoside phosphorylase